MKFDRICWETSFRAAWPRGILYCIFELKILVCSCACAKYSTSFPQCQEEKNLFCMFSCKKTNARKRRFFCRNGAWGKWISSRLEDTISPQETAQDETGFLGKRVRHRHTLVSMLDKRRESHSSESLSRFERSALTRLRVAFSFRRRSLEA